MPTSQQRTPSASCGSPTRFRPPRLSDGAGLWALAGAAGLDQNSPYAYLLWCEHFAAFSVVAARGDEVVGFVLGFRPPVEPDAVFVWQIAVAAPARGRGLGGRLLDELARRTGVSTLAATVTPSNEASMATFRSFASRHGAGFETDLAYVAALFPGDHEDEIGVRIGPLPRPPAPATQRM